MSYKEEHKIEHERDCRKVWIKAMEAAHRNKHLRPVDHADAVLAKFKTRFSASSLTGY